MRSRWVPGSQDAVRLRVVDTLFWATTGMLSAAVVLLLVVWCSQHAVMQMLQTKYVIPNNKVSGRGLVESVDPIIQIPPAYRFLPVTGAPTEQHH